MGWITPVKSKSKTKSTLFSMYKNLEVDDLTGFVLQKQKMSGVTEKMSGVAEKVSGMAGISGQMSTRPPYRIVSCSKYPHYEVAYAYSLDEIRSHEWAYIKTELPKMIPHNMTLEKRQEWTLNHLASLVVDSATSPAALSPSYSAYKRPEHPGRSPLRPTSDSDDELDGYHAHAHSHHFTVREDIMAREDADAIQEEFDGVRRFNKRILQRMNSEVTRSSLLAFYTLLSFYSISLSPLSLHPVNFPPFLSLFCLSLFFYFFDFVPTILGFCLSRYLPLCLSYSLSLSVCTNHFSSQTFPTHARV